VANARDSAVVTIAIADVDMIKFKEAFPLMSSVNYVYLTVTAGAALRMRMMVMMVVMMMMMMMMMMLLSC
jgi:hypothetical protein